MKTTMYSIIYIEDNKIPNIVNWSTKADLTYLKKEFNDLKTDILQNEPEIITDKKDIISWVNKYGQICTYQLVEIN